MLDLCQRCKGSRSHLLDASLPRGVRVVNPQCRTPLVNSRGCRASSGNVLFRRLQIAKKAGRWLFSRQAHTLWCAGTSVQSIWLPVFSNQTFTLYDGWRGSGMRGRVGGVQDLIQPWLDLITGYLAFHPCNPCWCLWHFSFNLLLLKSFHLILNSDRTHFQI